MQGPTADHPSGIGAGLKVGVGVDDVVVGVVGTPQATPSPHSANDSQYTDERYS